ncbi:MAG: isochorismatase family protein, partial [Chloroflexota bacterium]
KVAPSAFWGTPLAAHLNYNDVDTVIAVGESTSGCLRATVVEGTSHRFRMIVAEECSFDRHESAHAMNLFDMHQKYADVLPLDEVVAHLRTLRPSADSVPSRPELAGVA